MCLSVNVSEQVLFNPVMAADGGCGLSVAGSGTFRLLRAADGALKAAPCALAKREPQNYTAHAWLPDSALALPLSCRHPESLAKRDAQTHTARTPGCPTVRAPLAYLSWQSAVMQ